MAEENFFDAQKLLACEWYRESNSKSSNNNTDSMFSLCIQCCLCLLFSMAKSRNAKKKYKNRRTELKWLPMREESDSLNEFFILSFCSVLRPSLSTEFTSVIFEKWAVFFFCFFKTTKAPTKPSSSISSPKGHEVYYHTKFFIHSFKPSPGRFRLCLLCRRLSATKLWFNDDKYQTKHCEHTTTFDWW